MLSYGDISLRTANFVFLVIVLGLSGSLAATTITQSNSQVNFCVFAAVFAILTSTFYGLAAYFISFFASPLFLVILDFLNFVFTFAGATALAAAIEAHSCSNKKYLRSNNVTQGSSDRCRKAQATCAFLYFSFFIFLFSLAVQVIGMLKNGLFGSSYSSKPERTGVPTLSQV